MRLQLHCLAFIIGFLGTVYAQGKCPEGWAAFGDNCYFFSNTKYSFDVAREVCQAREGDLLAVNSAEELKFVDGIVEFLGSNFWLGLRRDPSVGGSADGWAWTDGSTPGPDDPEIRYWNEGRPNGNGDCANFRDTAPHYWNDIPCGDDRNFICKRGNDVLDKCNIEDGWHSYAGRCYKYFTDDVTWSDAKTVCSNNRGTLAVLDTTEKLDVFREIVSCKDFDAGVWIGLSDTDGVNQQLKWVNGQSLGSVTDWDDNQPIYLEDNNNCVEAMTVKHYKWRVERCSRENKFVCEKNEGTCADGWQDKETNFCYQVVSDPTQTLTWSDGMDRCENMGGNLMKITNAKEQEALVAIVTSLREQQIPDVRIGVSDMHTDDSFRWDDGSEVSFNKWAPDQPATVSERWDCGIINTAYTDAEWSTDYCFTRKPYICQIPLFVPPRDLMEPPVLICPEGWIGNPRTGDCYRFDDVKILRDAAKAYCKDLNQRANIIVVRNAQEQSFLNEHLRGSTWMDLRYVNNEWIWVELGVKPTFLNRDPYERKDPTSNPLGRLRNGDSGVNAGAWMQDPVEYDRFVACYMSADGTVDPTDIAPTYPGTPYCGAGWYYDPTSYNCFKLMYNDVLNWEASRSSCRALEDGSDLASITSLAEQTYINALIHSTVGGANGYWIGLNDRDLDKGWQWTDGSPVAFFFWHAGEPNGAGREYCVEVSPMWNDRWNDEGCDSQRGYICKKKSTQSTTPEPPLATDPPLPCGFGDGERLISGRHYVQDEYIRSYYSTGGYGTWEVKRGPHNARMDWEGEGTKTADCPNHMTSGVVEDNKYDYDVIDMQGWQDDYVLFEVQACNEAHIVLADRADLQEANLYEIIIGGWENSRTAIRKCLHNAGCGLDAQRDVQLLNCDKTRRFWVTWREGLVQLGRDYYVNDNMIIQYQYTDYLVEVKYFGVATAKNVEGSWCVPQGIENELYNTTKDVPEFPAGRGGSWTSYPDNEGQDLEVFFHEKFRINAIEIQGAPDRDEWVESFQILYRLTSEAPMTRYADSYGNTTIVGSTDRNTRAYYRLEKPVLASYIIIRPLSWNNKISMRLEVWGCRVYAETCPRENALSGAPYIPASKITASSFKEGFEPWRARLNGKIGWMPQEPYTRDSDFIQVQFDQMMNIHAISTQGREDGSMWVTRYKMSYARSCWVWNVYQEPFGTDRVFNGNTDPNTVVRNPLHTYVHASCARLWPQDWKDGIAMRLDFEVSFCPGCQPTEVISGDNHRIPDSQLSVSSYFGDASHGAASSRLNMPHNAPDHSGAWCAASDDGVGQAWIQADLGFLIRVYALATQGRNGQYEQWVTKYSIKYSREADGAYWHDYMEDGMIKEFEGNFNQNFARKHYFSNSFNAQLVRLTPLAYERHICVRWEIYACPGYQSRDEVGCYADQFERDLPYEELSYVPGGMTHEICSAHCASKGYSFAGAQFAKECFCGNSYGKYGLSTDCNMPCDGDPKDPPDMCGGAHANTILTTGLSPRNTRCADGYKEYNDKCWKAFTDMAKTWQDARFACQAEYGELATINSVEEQNFVTSTYATGMWIGLHCQANNYIFEWASQEPVYFTNWARREPNDFGDGEDCTLAFDNGLWNDVSCKNSRAYLCQKGKEVLPTMAPTEPDPSCPSGWWAYRWKCFTIRRDSQTWNAHKTFCESAGGNLARIEDSLDQSFIQSQIAGQAEFFWTDLNDREDPGSYKWTNGDSPSFTQWGSGQPDMSGEPSCVAMNDAEHGTWMDSDCEQAYAAVCERMREGETRPPTVPTNPGGGSCASGWTEFENHCFEFVSMADNLKRSWDDALAYCTEQGADLASVHSEDENLFIYEKVAVRNGNAFIGLSSRSEGGFKWSDGMSAEFFRWDTDEPSTDEGKECVEIRTTSGKWAAVQCQSTRNWVCKINKGQIPMTTVTVPPPDAGPPGSCYPDDDNWKFYKDVCYYFSGIESNPEPASWQVAQGWCNTQGGNLVSIHDADVQAFVEGQISTIPTYEMWIGLNELNGGGYEWVDGSVANYFNWDEGGPVDNGNLCVSMSVTYNNIGKWRNRACGLSNHFICAKNKGAQPISTLRPTPRPGGCPDGYTAFESKCFRVYHQWVNWGTARQRCLDDNKNSLASINDVHDQSFITTILRNEGDSYWIGLHDVEGQFLWADNSLVSYTNWAPGEPNGGGEEQCVHVYTEERRAGQWNDIDCETDRGYICMTYRDTSLPDPVLPDNGRCKELPGENWFLWNDDCYKVLSDQNRNWQEAEARCVEDGAHLTSVLSPYENGFLHGSLGWYSDEVQRFYDLWIGFSDKENPGSYRWSDGWSTLYTAWGNDQPDTTDGSCVYLNYNTGKWISGDCNRGIWSMCKHSLKDPTFTQPPASGQCPMAGNEDDWLEYGDACYIYSEDKVSFAEARHRCFMRSSDLVSIQNEEENDYLAAHVQNPSLASWWWTGLVKTTEGGFIWTDGRPYGYNNWENGEPSDVDGSQGENCVEMYATNGKWNDIICSNENAYICKYYKGDATPPNTPEPSLGSSTISVSTVFTGTTGAAPTNGPSTDRPDSLPPSNDGGGGLSSGGVVGLVFFLLFLLLAAILAAIFVMRRRGQPIPGVPNLTPDDGFENPSYVTSQGDSEA